MKRKMIGLLLSVAIALGVLSSLTLPTSAATHKIVMTAEEFIDCLKIAINRPNVYNNEYPYNLGYYDGSEISWDCWNLGKSIIWTKGSIVNNYTVGSYAKVDTSCGLGDWTGLTIIKLAPNCGSDFSSLVPGEWLYMDGHTGYYIGDGQVIECTKGWGVNGITYSQIDSSGNRSRNGVPNGKWIYHGMVPWIDYSASEGAADYFSNCSELYPSYGKATVKNACNPHPLPCSNIVAQKYGASSPAMTDKALSPGQSIEINGIIMNTEGHYWYKTTLSDGTSAYVFSDECMEMELLDPYFSGDILPEKISGATYLGGEIISRGARIDSVQAIVYHNNDNWDQAIASDVVYVNATDRFTLCKSQVDYSLPFQNLTEGYYFINIHAGITNYHLSADKTLVAKKAEYLIAAETFTYGNPGTCSHSYSESVTPPTCTNQGYTTYTCTKCGDSYTGNTVNALGHDYKTFVTEPTCTEQGYTAYACSRGDDLYYSNYVAAKGHSYGKWYTDSTQANTERRDCQRCGHYETSATSAHEHSYISSVTAPTCMEQGYTTYTCTTCGNRYVGNYVDAKGHQYGEWYEYEAVTCIGAGVNRSDCINCHSSCIYTKVQPLGHDFRSSITAPTCTEQGYTTYTCATCGDGYVDHRVAATGHQYGAWYVVKAATSTQEGIEQRDCKNCDTEEIQKLPIVNSPNHATQPSTSADPSTPAETDSSKQIIIICVFAAVALVIGIAIGKKRK